MILILHVNVRDDSDNLSANVTLVTNTLMMLRFTKHCKDMRQERFMILISFCSTFITVYTCQ